MLYIFKDDWVILMSKLHLVFIVIYTQTLIPN